MSAGIRSQRYTWFDKVALWRGRATWGMRNALGYTDSRYYFQLARFVHRVEATTISQMEVVRLDGQGFWDVT